jgi:hypothetical protein
MVDFKTILFTFVLMGLFGTLIITAVVEQGNLYSKNLTEVSQGALDLNQFNGSISTIQSQADDLRESFQKQNIFVSLGNLVISGFFNIVVAMINMILTPFTLIAGIMTNIFYVPAFVTNVILGLLIFSIIFSIFRILKIGW